MPKRSSKRTRRPKDTSRIDKFVVNLTTGDPVPEKNPAAVALGRLGGLKGGKARAESLSPKRRKQIAKHAAQARWGIRPE
jgi:hypothetical protein